MRIPIITAALLAPLPAHAQDETRDAPIVVTASRSDKGVPLDELGGSATVIDAEALEQRQTRVLSDVLRDVPGVAVSRLGGVGGQTQLRIRGTEGNHVLVLIDGIEVSDPFQGEYDFGTLIADDAARVEVLRGQQSSLYGSDAIGGVVQYFTLAGREAPGVRLRAEGGSFGTFAGGARLGGGDERVDYAANATWLRTDGTPSARDGSRNIGAESVAGSFKLGWRPGEALRLSAVGRYARTNADFNDTDFDPASPRFGLIVDSPGVRSETEALYALVKAEIGSGRWTGALTAQIADTTRDSFDGASRTSGNLGKRYKGSAVTTLQLGAPHRLTLALDAEREAFRNTTPSPFAFNGRRSTENLGLVAQYALNLGVVSAGASLRRDENNRFDDATTWRAQGSWRIAPATRLRAAAGSGIKNPGFFELYGFSDGVYIGNPNLKPERSEGYEIGVDQDFAGGAIGLTFFDSTLKNEIFTTFPPPDFVSTPGNRASESRQRGIEAFLSARPSQGVRIDAAYTYLRAREDGEVEVRRPKHIASLILGYDADRFSITATARYNGRQRDLAFTDPSFVPVIARLDDFALLNVAAEYRLDRVTLFGRVENALDEEYEEVFGYRASGFAAFAGVKARL